uniref:Uncharacterized protein n=1 Tax=Ascaris lumbricoides TaxID=6252 RepID=A0A0M3HLI7_ASCLU
MALTDESFETFSARSSCRWLPYSLNVLNVVNVACLLTMWNTGMMKDSFAYVREWCVSE